MSALARIATALAQPTAFAVAAARQTAVPAAIAVALIAIGADATASAQTLPGAPPGAFRFSRPILEVERGWLRIPLGEDFVGKIAPDGRNVRVFDAEGREVPAVFIARDDPQIQIAAQVVGVDETAAGWTITLDTGLDAAGDAALHDGLRLDFEEPVLASGIRLQASDDGAVWSDLATADLFRLGNDPGLALTGIDYPPSDARYLRVDWPAAAGFPELTTAAVRTVAVDTPRFEVEPALELWRSGPGHASYGLAHPWLAQAVEAQVALTSGRADYRLSAPEAGRWIERSVGSLTHRENSASSTRLSFGAAGMASALETFDAVPSDMESAPWRLELFARDGEPLPDIEGISVLVVAPDLYFLAGRAGDYTLAYGGAGLGPPAPAQPEDRPDRVYGALPRARLGAEVELARPTQDPGRAGGGGPMPDASFDGAWPIEVPGVADDAGATAGGESAPGAESAGAAVDRTAVQIRTAPGAVVDLELSEAVLAVARADLSDLRIAAGERQAPYLRVEPPDPALVLSAEGLVPEVVTDDRGARRSTVMMEMAETELPLSQIELSSRAGPFERDVTIAWVGAPAGLEELTDPALRRRPIERRAWRCDPALTAPCRIAFDLSADPARGIEITFEDGDNEPIASLDAAVWRRRVLVRFIWPSGAAPVLHAGAVGLSAPRYDLAPLRSAVVAGAPIEATLGDRLPLTGARGVAAAAESAEFLPLAALGLAALALLAVLWRLMRAPGSADGQGDTER